MSLNQRIALRLRRRLHTSQPASGIRHSRAYHKHFQGWAEHEVLDSHGRTRIERVYVGDYYRLEGGDGARLALRVAYALLYALSAALFLLPSVQPTGSNTWGIMGVAQLLSLLGLAWLLTALFVSLTAPRVMTVSQWSAASVRLKRASLTVVLCLGATLLLTLLYPLLVKENTRPELPSAGAYLLSALASLAINRLENYARYTLEKNPNETPPSAVTIE